MKRAERCYLCGVQLVPVPRGYKLPLQDNHATRDHVPPDGLFYDPKPSNLITVPCCHKCNSKHSGVDERLRMVAAMALGRNEGGERVLLDRVIGSTMKKARQPQFVMELVESKRQETIITRNRRTTVTVFSVPGAEELYGCASDIAKGLLAHFYPQFDYHSHHFASLDIHAATLAKGQADQQLRKVQQIMAMTQGDSRGNNGEFHFWRQVDLETGRGGWLLIFYGALAFVVLHSGNSSEPYSGLTRSHAAL
jgi:hypothetical protein